MGTHLPTSVWDHGDTFRCKLGMSHTSRQLRPLPLAPRRRMKARYQAWSLPYPARAPASLAQKLPPVPAPRLTYVDPSAQRPTLLRVPPPPGNVNGSQWKLGRAWSCCLTTKPLTVTDCERRRSDCGRNQTGTEQHPSSPEACPASLPDDPAASHDLPEVSAGPATARRDR
jgi:hypothetical protein